MQKKKHKTLWIVLVILAVLVIGFMMVDTDEAPEATLPATEPTETAAPTTDAAAEPQTEAETEAEAKTEPIETEPAPTEPEETEDVLVDGMRPEFKEAMDSYEAFMDEYCAFMQEYNDNPADLELLGKYGKLMVQYEEAMRDFENWDDGTLNSAEYAYYMEVSGRVLQKLGDVMASAQG